MPSGLEGEKFPQAVREMVDASELGDDNRLDADAEVGADLRMGDLAVADAFAVVLDKDVRQLGCGQVAVALARLAGEHATGREIVVAENVSLAMSSGFRWELR